MKIIKFDKNSEEWLEYRKGKSGGSEFGNLYSTSLPLVGQMKAKLDQVGITYAKTAKAEELAKCLTPHDLAELKLRIPPKMHYYEIVADATLRPITPNDYVDRLNGTPFSMMARGHLLEPEALEAFNNRTGKNADGTCVVWESEDNPNIYISPDACIYNDNGKITEAVEIKCLSNAEVVKAYLTGNYPKEYNPQIYKYFIVNPDLKQLHFVIYTDAAISDGLTLQIWTVKREDIADKLAEAKEYEEQVMARIEADVARITALEF